MSGRKFSKRWLPGRFTRCGCRTLSAKFTMAALRMLLADIPDGSDIVAHRAYDNNNVLDFIAWMKGPITLEKNARLTGRHAWSKRVTMRKSV